MTVNYCSHVTKIIYSNRCDHSEIINKHGDFFYFTHEYGLYPIVTDQLLAAFNCLKCTKGEVVAEAQKLIGPYRWDYVVLVIKQKRTDVVTYPILLVEVKFSVAAYIDNVNSSDITEMFLYVKYVFEEHQNINTIYCVLTDGTTGHGFFVKLIGGNLSVTNYFKLPDNNLCSILRRALQLP